MNQPLAQAGRPWAPGSPSVASDDAGDPVIRAYRCADCAAAVAEKSLCCPACGTRDSLDPFGASGKGKVATYTVVHRSYPGVAVPFISVVVAMDEGFGLKACLRGVPMEPSSALVGLPVTVQFDLLDGQVDPAGKPYLAYHVEPSGEVV